MDESLTGGPDAELRDVRAWLEAAREDVTTLRVLLATRTHQHDLAWQTVQRLTAELATERARAEALAAAAQAEVPVPPADPAEDLADELFAARERFAAAQTVIEAAADSLGWRGLDRRRFRALIAQAGRAVPETGPQAVRHIVLHDGARRVLGLRS